MDVVLPAEVLSRMCDHLDGRSLVNFSLSSKHCRYAAIRVSFCTVHVRFSSPASLSADVERWDNVLTSSGSLQHVRHFKVLAARLLVPREFGLVNDLGDDPKKPWKYCGVDQAESVLITHEAAEWQKLYQLVRKLPALRQVTWGCVERIPPCILRHLHKNLPDCRLHLRNLGLESFSRPPGFPTILEPYDLEVATSPCLYSIAMRLPHLEDSEGVNYQESAVMEMVAGAAPNLKEVCLVFGPANSVRPVRFPGKTWRSGTISKHSTTKDTTRVALKSLEVVTLDTGAWPKYWSSIVDFSALQSLKIHSRVTRLQLAWLTDHCRLSSLQDLVLNLPGRSAAVTEAFISCLPPLRSLKLMGLYSRRTVLHAVDHCNSNLRQLFLSFPDCLHKGHLGPDSASSFATLGVLQELREKCTSLEELAISLLRTRGDATEVEIYRALGKISTLCKIHLSIYCPRGSTRGDPNKDEPFSEDEQYQLDEAVINLAVDEELAETIFHTVSTAKAPYAPPLEHLVVRINAFEGQVYFWPPVRCLLNHIARSWVCQRNPRDDSPHQCFVEEFNQHLRLQEQKRQKSQEKMDLGDVVSGVMSSTVLRLWPGVPIDDWEDGWFSFPLAL